jgi:hypothetical protein
MNLFDLTKRPTRHSYSSIKKYQECPAAYGYSYIQKLPDEPSAAMMRGTRLHKLAEDYMNNTNMPVPYDIKKVGLKIFQLRELGAKAEQVWLLDSDWNRVEHQDNAKIKAIVDVHRLTGDLLKLHDYKSGREYPSHADQLEFYATVGLFHTPSAKRAEASAIYFDTGHEGATRSIIRDMLPFYREKWGTYIDTMDNDRSFGATAGSHCNRCAYSSKNGGPCTEWSKA